MLTPDDIVNYPLKQAVRGYSVKQVDELLDQVADSLERSETELAELRERLVASEQHLAETSETEATLKRTLVTAQRAAEQSLEEAKSRAAELVDEARRESVAIVEQAKLEAEELRLEAVQAARAEEAELRHRRQALEAQIEELRVFEREFRGRLRNVLDEQLRLLEELPSRPAAPRPEVPEGADAPPVEQGTGRDASNHSLGASQEGPRLTVRVRDEEGGQEAPAAERTQPEGTEPEPLWGRAEVPDDAVEQQRSDDT